MDATALDGECYCRATGFERFNPEDCEQLVVWDATDVRSVVPQSHNWVSPYGIGSTPITVDLVAATPLALHIDDLCDDPTDCASVSFNHGGAVPPGVVLQGEEEVHGIPLPMWLIAEAGARFRIRAPYLNIHPIQPQYLPVLEPALPCRTPCGENQGRCPEDQVCLSAGRNYCLGCSDLSLEECECRDPDGIAPDGTPCTYFVTSDVHATGECQSGVCEL